jgi:pimeloyl-ACP methyl ester carboxylesterase
MHGLDLHYELQGAGPRLLFLNGSGATLTSSAQELAGLASHFEVLAHDQRGLGRSAIPPGPYSMADYALDAAALVDHVGWDGCRVLGISFGGMVAQEFAVRWPARVERLALLCTSPGGPAPSYPLHELLDLPHDERAPIALRLLDERFTPDWLATHPDDQRLVATLAGHAMAPRTDEQVRGEREQLLARRDHDVYDRLGAVSCPTLVACGRYDGIAPVANGEAIVERIPGAELHVYDGGHAFWRSCPEAFTDVRDFLLAP